MRGGRVTRKGEGSGGDALRKPGGSGGTLYGSRGIDRIWGIRRFAEVCRCQCAMVRPRQRDRVDSGGVSITTTGSGWRIEGHRE